MKMKNRFVKLRCKKIVVNQQVFWKGTLLEVIAELGNGKLRVRCDGRNFDIHSHEYD